ncbi:hypothetical protein GCM10025866_34240 [Naasia aerilata]|uniref:Core-binding (CB) domain-containing protein n=1 Tax=Naasia aerilata TaxID=1162966 RepID=A0ABM8GGP0_9MICO|nr:hypothetical protein GCM10025866_34240 [Naasia aerilata]
MTPEAAVAAYLRHVSIERGLAANSVAAYRRDLTAYAAFLGERGIDDISRVASPDVAAFSQHLRGADGTAMRASSVGRMLSSVRGLHRFLVDDRVVDADPAAEVKPPKLGLRLPKAITVDEMAALLAAVAGRSRSRCGTARCSSSSTRRARASGRRSGWTSTT